MSRILKLTSITLVIMVLMLTIIPQHAEAQTNYFGLNSSLVTNVKQKENARISFYVTASQSKPVTYKIYLYNKDSKPNYKTLPGPALASGTVKKNCEISIDVPVTGYFYIASSNQFEKDDDYIRVTLKSTYKSKRIDWDKKAVANFQKNKKIETTTQLIGTTAVAIVLLFTPAAPLAQVAITTGLATLELAYNNSQEYTIDKFPQEGFSWQYEYTPIDSGYKMKILVYKIGGSEVINTINLGDFKFE